MATAPCEAPQSQSQLELAHFTWRVARQFSCITQLEPNETPRLAVRATGKGPNELRCRKGRAKRPAPVRARLATSQFCLYSSGPSLVSEHVTDGRYEVVAGCGVVVIPSHDMGT